MAVGSNMADSKLVNKRTCEIRCYIYRLYFCQISGNEPKTLMSPNVEPVISVPLSVLEISALIVDLS